MKRQLRALCILAAGIAAPGILTTAVATSPAPPAVERFSVASGRELRAWDDAIARMERALELRLRATQVDTLVAGRSLERLHQYYRGVRVFGGEVVRETDGKVVLSATGTLYTGIDVDPTPVLTPEAALAVFDRENGAPSAPRAAPELVVLPKADGTFALCYRVTAFVKHALPVVFVNARTGAVERRYNNLKTQQPAAGIGTGVYGDEKKLSGTLQGSTYLAWDQMRPTKIVTNDLRGNVTRTVLLESGLAALVASDMATSGSERWTDAPTVDAHCYLGWTYDFFYNRFGWKGLNNSDSRAVYAIVHPVNRSDIDKYAWEDVGNYYANASFCTQCGASGEDVVMFGEGLPQGFYFPSLGQTATYMSAALDIVAHEYAHGVTDYTSGLIYQDEPGALSEAFSDVMSTGVEFYFQTPGSGVLKADYVQGEDAWTAAVAGALSGIRSLADPAAFGHPDHYSKKVTDPSDNGGVHSNATIVGHVFYLAIEGGTNRTSGQAVQGVGAANREQVEKAFFRGFLLLPSDATFSQARATTIQSATDLYGASSAAVKALTQAWSAAGVQ